ncbi:MAG TPA: MFS transporter [Actinomycetota bacterium]|nr:MFS transporter [Actinomycetota bacterium]
MALGRTYRKLWTAAAISNLGDGVVLTATPLLAASLTRNPLLVANVAVLERLPWAIFALVSGALVDRWDRRRVMTTVDIVRGLIFCVLGAAIIGEWMSLPLLYVGVFILGTGETLFDNAAQAIMPMIVERKDLERANARLYAAQIVTTEFAGPPIGSFLFAAAASAPFFIDGASFIGGALIVAFIVGSFRPARDEALPPARLTGDIKEGLRWLWHHPPLPTMALSLGVFNFLFNGAYSIMVLFALEALHLRASAFGLLLLAGAAGSFVGSMVGPNITRRVGGGPALVLIGVVSGAAMLAMAFLSNAWIVGPLLAIEAFASIVWNVITVSLRQSMIPEHLMGRVNSAYRLVGWGTIPLGALVGGIVAKTFGIRTPFYAGGALLVIAAVTLFRHMVPQIAAVEAAQAAEDA